jgi:hypothetical protein
MTATDGRTGLPLAPATSETPHLEWVVTQVAKAVGLDEGYTWQRHPTQTQSRKQSKLIKRAWRYLDIVMRGST